MNSKAARRSKKIKKEGGLSKLLRKEGELWQQIYRRPIPFDADAVLILSAILRFTLFAERVREMFSQTLGLRTFELWAIYSVFLLENCKPPYQMPVAEIASILRMAPRANPSEVIGRLRAKDLVATRTATGDKRRSVIVLTPRGRILAHSIFSDYEKLAKEVINGVDEAAAPVALSFLRTVLGNLERIYAKSDLP